MDSTTTRNPLRTLTKILLLGMMLFLPTFKSQRIAANMKAMDVAIAFAGMVMGGLAYHMYENHYEYTMDDDCTTFPKEATDAVTVRKEPKKRSLSAPPPSKKDKPKTQRRYSI